MPHQALLYYCDSRLTPVPTMEDLLCYLDHKELERHQRMRSNVGQRFYLGRRLVKDALAERLHCDPADLQFAYSDNGKPYLPGAEPLHFSISHSASAVVAVVADCNVGVDVELVERNTHLTPPWEQPEKFMPAENAALVLAAETADKPRLFTLLWTLMESQVKWADSAIFHAIRSLVIEVDTAANPMHAQVADSACRWRAYEALLGQKDMLAVACAEPDLVLSLFEWRQKGGHRPLTAAPILQS